MKNIFYTLCFLLLLGCQDNKQEIYPTSFLLSASSSYEVMALSPSSINFDIENALDCEINNHSTWMSVRTHKDRSTVNVVLSFEDNKELAERYDTLIISSVSADTICKILIKQYGCAFDNNLIVTKQFDRLSSDEVPVYSLEISSKTDWKISTPQAWLVFHKTQGTPNQQTMQFHAIANCGQERTAVITVSNVQGDSLSFEVTQDATSVLREKHRVGDPDISFDYSKMDPNFPQMKEWIEAGVENGIPVFSSTDIKKTISSTNSAGITSAMKAVANAGGGILLLKNGIYDIDQMITMVSNVTIRGETRDGVVLRVMKELTKDAIKFRKVTFCGLSNLTIRGMWLNKEGENVPLFAENGDLLRIQQIEENGNLVHFDRYSSDPVSSTVHNCWLDGVNLINALTHPIYNEGHHITFRDLVIDGAFNKDGGCQGYFFLGGHHCLVTGCHVSRLRHISLQGEEVMYHVLYDNDFNQEISFHCNDGGNNLIEYNRITTPVYMTSDYVPIMGPWSTKHAHSRQPNYVYHNDCRCPNNGDKRIYADDRLYIGPFRCLSGATFEQHVGNFEPVPNTNRPWEYVPTKVFDNKGTGIYNGDNSNGPSYYDARIKEGNFTIIVTQNPAAGTLYPIIK